MTRSPLWRPLTGPIPCSGTAESGRRPKIFRFGLDFLFLVTVMMILRFSRKCCPRRSESFMAQVAVPPVADPVGDASPIPPSPRSRLALPAAFSQWALLGALLVTIAIFGALRPDSFLTLENLKSTLNTAAPLLVVALGLTVVLVMQDFDLSVAGMMGLGGAVAVVLMGQHGVPWQLAIVLALCVGVLGGLLNAFLIAYLGGSAFIITLAMSTVFVGLEFAVTGQKTIFDGIPDGFANFAQSRWVLDLPAQVFIA